MPTILTHHRTVIATRFRVLMTSQGRFSGEYPGSELYAGDRFCKSEQITAIGIRNPT
jgi:hypothetical protein